MSGSNQPRQTRRAPARRVLARPVEPISRGLDSRMFGELTPAEIAQVAPLFSLPQLNLVMRAVIHGHSPARVWGDPSSAPQTALMYDGRHCIYLAGDAD